MSINKIIKKRASLRKYAKRKVSHSKIIEIIEAGNHAPSPGNLSIARFVIVEDKEKIHQITEATQQAFVNDAQFIIVICSEAKRVKPMYEDRTDRYIKHHIGALVENMLLKITDLGLASCWVEAFSDITMRNILKIPENIEIEVILPIAYPSKISKETQKQKPDLDNRIFFEKYKNKYQKPFRKVGSH